MLNGKEFGKAIRRAVELKLETGRVRTKAEIARHFEMAPASLFDWMNKGTVSKEKLPELWRYFSDVAGPDHWGISAGEWPVELSDRLAIDGESHHIGEDSPIPVLRLPVKAEKTERELAIERLMNMVDALDLARIGQLTERAAQLLNEMPAKQTRS